MFAAPVLFRCEGVVEFSVCHCAASKEFVVHIMVCLDQHDGAHAFDVVVAWFLVQFHINALEPAAHGVTSAEGYGAHDGVELTEDWIGSVSLPHAEVEAGWAGQCFFLRFTPCRCVLFRCDV